MEREKYLIPHRPVAKIVMTMDSREAYECATLAMVFLTNAADCPVASSDHHEPQADLHVP